MILYGLIIEGQVWGIGDTKVGALADAEREFVNLMAMEARRLVHKSDAPSVTAEPEFMVLDLETAKQVANRDLRCPLTPRVWGKVVS
jgi:hypothetical protein